MNPCVFVTTSELTAMLWLGEIGVEFWLYNPSLEWFGDSGDCGESFAHTGVRSFARLICVLQGR